MVVVTGGSSGIGFGVAERLAGCGARVVLVAHDAGKLEMAVQRLGGEPRGVSSVVCDIGDPALVATAMGRLVGEHGVPDMLINNAGFAVYRAFEQSSADEIERLFEVNFAGHLRCTKALLAGMIARRQGQIVNVASIAGLITLTPNAVYGAAKFGMIAWSRALRIELARFGVGVTVVCPGRVETPFFDDETFRQRRPRPETRLTIPLARVVETVLEAGLRNREIVTVPRYLGWVARLAAAVPLASSAQHAMLRRRVDDLYVG
jgi:short-subunit dehydrogenase